MKECLSDVANFPKLGVIITPNNWSYNSSLKITVHYHYNSRTKNIERDAKPLQNSDWQRLIRLMIRQMA